MWGLHYGEILMLTLGGLYMKHAMQRGILGLEIHLNNIEKFSSYLTENTLRLQSINAL
jgi:hypothetical protein